MTALYFIQLLMGNQAQATTRKMTKNSRYSRNSYSLEDMSAHSKVIEKISSERDKSSPIILNNLSQLARPDLSMRQIEPTTPIMSLQLSNLKRSATNSRVKEENDSRLVKLNVKNDQLRKQLIKLSSELTGRLHRKKYQQKKKQLQNEGEQEKKGQGLRRQLENGYKQVDRYKKIIDNLKANQNPQNQTILNQMEGKILSVDLLIKDILNQIEAAKNILKNQQKMVKKAQNDSNNLQLKEVKAEIQKLKNSLKKNNKLQRKKDFKQKTVQQYMFQLQRRFRQMNGDYLPELKSYANKNFVPEPKLQKKKKDELGNFKPGHWQITDAAEQLKTLKQKHQDYHIKIQKALKNKTAIKQESQRVKQQLQNSQKLIQTLIYKKDRYLQMVMGNIDFLMNEDDALSDSGEGNSSGFRVITKGNDVPDQVFFDDHQLMKNTPWNKVKLVSVNIWYTNKRQIAALQGIYFNGKDCFMGNRTSTITGDMQKQILQVEEADYIKNIMGSFNKKGAIQFLAFNSVKGKAKQFGKQLMNGLNFTLNLTKKERPVCLSGFTFFDGTYWRINKLIVDVIHDD